MKLEKLLQRADVRGVAGNTGADAIGLATDSRQVRPGFVFIAVPGAARNGWDFVGDALQRGAVAVVGERLGKPRGSQCYVQVADAREAAADLACAFHGDPSNFLQLAGVTGTNGKTTTCYLVRAMLEAAGKRCGVIGTVEHVLGERVIPASRTTPDAPLLQSMLSQMVRSGCRAAAMEVSSHGLVQKRVRGVDFDVGVFTNLTHEHLDYHGTMDEYFAAKMLLFRQLGTGRKRAAGAVNADDPWGRRLLAEPDLKAELLAFGEDRGAAVSASDVKVTPAGCAFFLGSPWGSARVRSALRGRFNVHNALAAVAAGGLLGLDFDLMAGVLADPPVVPGRLEEIRSSLGFQTFVDYAHTADALAHVLRTLREITRKRLIVVFGCGGNRDRAKRPAMGGVAAELADYAVLTSDNPRGEEPDAIIREIEAGFSGTGVYEVIPDRSEAIRAALSAAERGDVVLIAGKGHENFQEYANKIVPFDDRLVARRLLEQLEAERETG